MRKRSEGGRPKGGGEQGARGRGNSRYSRRTPRVLAVIQLILLFKIVVERLAKTSVVSCLVLVLSRLCSLCFKK